MSLLIATFLYDLIFNNLIIQYVYIILPYVFLYNLYAKASKFLLCRFAMNDQMLNSFIYYEVKLDEYGNFITVSYPMRREDFRELLTDYLLKGLHYNIYEGIHFEKKFYIDIIYPIKTYLEWRHWQVEKYLKKNKPMSLFDVGFLFICLMLIQVLINKYL